MSESASSVSPTLRCDAGCTVTPAVCTLCSPPASCLQRIWIGSGVTRADQGADNSSVTAIVYFQQFSQVIGQMRAVYQSLQAAPGQWGCVQQYYCMGAADSSAGRPSARLRSKHGQRFFPVGSQGSNRDVLPPDVRCLRLAVLLLLRARTLPGSKLPKLLCKQDLGADCPCSDKRGLWSYHGLSSRDFAQHPASREYNLW